MPLFCNKHDGANKNDNRGSVDATGEPVIGASVLEVGTTNGTITDVDGNFTIQVPVGAKLDVSYIGYKTQQIVVGVPNTYKVILKEDAEMLDESW